ncbi:hypothetical protein EI42_02320 [Thermosporothrix hazakensis]|uniref:Uncharacterized protein n=1 Tax=Thermosporothrix hazakensis TaxID=644383 RepID=A0A326UA30_THEHA|nr:hypothetical protein EI42_02320 [Thermosporothrix hazakensis]
MSSTSLKEESTLYRSTVFPVPFYCNETYAYYNTLLCTYVKICDNNVSPLLLLLADRFLQRHERVNKLLLPKQV